MVWPQGLKYLLYEWEEHLAAGRSVLLSWDKVEQRDLSRTIEHILPQTPTDIYWRTRFDPAARELLTHDLGNLVLTDDNSSYRNKPFPEKRGTQGLKKANGDLAPCYANSILLQERALDSLDDWTPNHVRARRRELLAWARDRWHVDESRAVSEGIDVDEAEHEEAEEMAD